MKDENLRVDVLSVNKDPNMDIIEVNENISNKTNRAKKSKNPDKSAGGETKDLDTVKCHQDGTAKNNKVKKRKIGNSSEREGDLQSLEGIKKLKKPRLPPKKRCKKKEIENSVVLEEIVFADNVINLPYPENSNAGEIADSFS